jgi:hypothetical protein
MLERELCALEKIKASAATVRRKICVEAETQTSIDDQLPLVALTCQILNRADVVGKWLVVTSLFIRVSQQTTTRDRYDVI